MKSSTLAGELNIEHISIALISSILCKVNNIMCRCSSSSTRLDWLDHESMVLLLMLNGVANY